MTKAMSGSDLENELLRIAENVENLDPNMNDMNFDHQKTSTRVISPSNEEKENLQKRKEVVRYVEIPSSFPHFPRLDELYDSNSNLDDKMMEKSHFMLPIRDKNEKVMNGCRLSQLHYSIFSTPFYKIVAVHLICTFLFSG